MSVITKELARDFNVPKKCEQCNKKAAIWWMLHVRQNPKDGINPEHGIANIGFCENHALAIVFGLMRDVDDVQRSRMAKRKAPNDQALPRRAGDVNREAD